MFRSNRRRRLSPNRQSTLILSTEASAGRSVIPLTIPLSSKTPNSRHKKYLQATLIRSTKASNGRQQKLHQTNLMPSINPHGRRHQKPSEANSNLSTNVENIRLKKNLSTGSSLYVKSKKEENDINVSVKDDDTSKNNPHSDENNLNDSFQSNIAEISINRPNSNRQPEKNLQLKSKDESLNKNESACEQDGYVTTEDEKEEKKSHSETAGEFDRGRHPKMKKRKGKYRARHSKVKQKFNKIGEPDDIKSQRQATVPDRSAPSVKLIYVRPPLVSILPSVGLSIASYHEPTQGYSLISSIEPSNSSSITLKDPSVEHTTRDMDSNTFAPILKAKNKSRHKPPSSNAKVAFQPNLDANKSPLEIRHLKQQLRQNYSQKLVASKIQKKLQIVREQPTLIRLQTIPRDLRSQSDQPKQQNKYSTLKFPLPMRNSKTRPQQMQRQKSQEQQIVLLFSKQLLLQDGSGRSNRWDDETRQLHEQQLRKQQLLWMQQLRKQPGKQQQLNVGDLNKIKSPKSLQRNDNEMDNSYKMPSHTQDSKDAELDDDSTNHTSDINGRRDSQNLDRDMPTEGVKAKDHHSNVQTGTANKINHQIPDNAVLKSEIIEIADKKSFNEQQESANDEKSHSNLQPPKSVTFLTEPVGLLLKRRPLKTSSSPAGHLASSVPSRIPHSPGNSNRSISTSHPDSNITPVDLRIPVINNSTALLDSDLRKKHRHSNKVEDLDSNPSLAGSNSQIGNNENSSRKVVYVLRKFNQSVDIPASNRYSRKYSGAVDASEDSIAAANGYSNYVYHFDKPSLKNGTSPIQQILGDSKAMDNRSKASRRYVAYARSPFARLSIDSEINEAMKNISDKLDRRALPELQMISPTFPESERVRNTFPEFRFSDVSNNSRIKDAISRSLKRMDVDLLGRPIIRKGKMPEKSRIYLLRNKENEVLPVKIAGSV